MTWRAVLKAAGLALLLFVRAFAVPPAPVALDRSADNHATLKAMRVMLQALPESAVKKQALPLVAGLDDQAARLPREKREDFLAQRLPELSALAGGLSTDFVPKDVLKRVQNGVAYLDTRASRWEEAARICETVLRLDPRDRDARLSRSAAQYGLKNFKAAWEDAQAAVRLDPDGPDGYTARAMAAYGLADYLQAMEDARRALAIAPNDRTAYALMHLAEGRVPPTPIQDLKSRLDVGVQREYQGMVTQITQVAARSQRPASAPASTAVARLLHDASSRIALKDYFAAVQAADKVLVEDPNNTAAYYYRAAAHNLIGQYGDAVADASQALALDPAETSARDARAFAYNRLGRFHDALADANHSLELDPKNPYAFANRGFAHEKTGDLEGMLADLKKASELSPQFEPEYHDAAAAYGLDLPTAARPAQSAPPLANLRHKQFAVILLCSLAGGLLVALGLPHVLGRGRLRADASDPAAGEHPTRFAIEQAYALGPALGQGGMGVVYQAEDKVLGRKVAIKMLLDEFQVDAEAKARMLDEARTVAALHHPNIVDIHSVLSDDRGLYLVFEFLSGQTVEALLARRGKFPIEEAKALLKPVCSALDFAHQRSVVHRDLKPGNIMITEQGVVKVMDFGISRRVKETLKLRPGPRRGWAVTNTVAGTPYYMAPEQEYGAVRPESDIYSLGTCLYEMLTGHRPYPPPAGYVQKLAADYTKPSALEPCLPRSLDVLIDGALHPDPDRRIRTAADFWGLLEGVSSPDPGIAPS